MRKIIHCALLVYLIPLVCNGQNESVFRLDSIISQNRFKKAFIYNCIDRLSMSILYKWDTTCEIWVASCKTACEYDNYGNIISETYYNRNFINNYWIPTGKTQFNYDTNALINKIEYEWMPQNKRYLNKTKCQLKYNTEYQIDKIYYYNWDTTSAAWICNKKEDYIYLESGELDNIIYYDWNKINNEWVIQNKGSWCDEEKTEYILDTSVSYYNMIVPYCYKWDYMLLKIQKFLYTPFDNEWELKSENMFYYSYYNKEDIENSKNNEVEVYPLIVNDNFFVHIKVNFKTAGFNLYNIHGRTVLSLKLTISNKISIESMPPGIYVYNVTLDDNIYCGKIIKQ